MTDVPYFVTAKTVAEMLKISPRTVRRWAAAGVLPGYRIRNEVRFDLAEVLALVRRES